jgi:hypothetical protein
MLADRRGEAAESAANTERPTSNTNVEISIIDVVERSIRDSRIARLDRANTDRLDARICENPTGVCQ